MRKSFILIGIFFIVKSYSITYYVQAPGLNNGDITCCVGDTISFFSCSTAGPSAKFLQINTDTMYYYSFYQLAITFNHVVTLSDTSYLLRYGNKVYSGKIIVQCLNDVKTINDLIFKNISPNPTSNNITITSSKNIDEIKIRNVLGQLVTPSAFGISPTGEKTTLDVSTLENGIYFITIVSGKESSTQKLIVQH